MHVYLTQTPTAPVNLCNYFVSYSNGKCAIFTPLKQLLGSLKNSINYYGTSKKRLLMTEQLMERWEYWPAFGDRWAQMGLGRLLQGTLVRHPLHMMVVGCGWGEGEDVKTHTRTFLLWRNYTLLADILAVRPSWPNIRVLSNGSVQLNYVLSEVMAQVLFLT